MLLWLVSTKSLRSPSPRRAWIEIRRTRHHNSSTRSPSPRRAWIEILQALQRQRKPHVALPTEGVDRNHLFPAVCQPVHLSPSPRRAWIEIPNNWELPSIWSAVALPTEGVDRNGVLGSLTKKSRVALPTEGVDRNSSNGGNGGGGGMSPSPRRVWIEMRTADPKTLRRSRRPPHGGRG